MFNPRGNMPPRPRGPNAPGPRAPFQGPEPGPGGLQRHGIPQQFMGAGFPRPNVQVTQHRVDPRQARGKGNVQRQQKEQGRTTRWDNPLTPGNNNQNQPASGRIAEQTTSVQSRYTNESASSILASFGLSNEDLEELSRYPDDQLTPENMPLILRDIRIHKMTRKLTSLPSQTREKASFSKDGGSMVQSKVIDYGHESKYGYTKCPLDVKVYGSDVPTEQSMKGFQAQETAPATATSSNAPSNALNAVEELIRQMGFQRSTPATQPFFSMTTANKVPGLCLPSAVPVVPPAVQPMMPPVVSPMPQPVAQQTLPPPPVVQPMMPAMNQPPPPFVPPHGPMGGQKTFQKETDNPIESPFGVVKASWLPVFSQADAQKMKRLPTPSMMNDYYAASPRIFPHMCSLCNVECRHLKDWIQHQNTPAHIESCRQLRQQYPDWNPEAHSSPKRCEGDRKENVRHRSASPSPKRSRRSSSGHGRQRSRSRSPGRLRPGRRLPSPRHRSRSPRRSHDSSSWSQGSCSRERGLGRSTESPDKALEDAVKCLGPRFVEQFNRQKSLHMFSRDTSGPKRMSPEPGKALGRVMKPPSAPVGPPKPSKMDFLSQSGSSKLFGAPFGAADTSNQGGMVADGKNKKLPIGASVAGAKETSVAAPAPAPYNRLLTDKLLRCGTVLHITDLPDDGFSDHDIKKIVQPFGKVSDLLVLRSRNEAFLEMNYKEAAIAAIKYSNTVPVVINRRRVKISIAEKPSASLSQNKGNGKVITKAVKKPPLNTQKEQANSAEKITKPTAPATPTPNTAKTNIKKPEGLPKVEKEPAGAKVSGATKAAAEPKMPAGAKNSGAKKAAAEPKMPAGAKNSGATKAAAEPKMPAGAKNSGATKAAAEPKMPAGAKNSGATKAAAEPKMPAGAKNSGATKAAAEPKMPAGAKNSGATKAAAEPKMPAGAKNSGATKAAAEPKMPAGAKNSGATKVAAELKMPAGAKNSGATKAAAEPKMPAGAKNSGATKAAAEPKMPAGAKNSGATKVAAEPKMPAGAKNSGATKAAAEPKMPVGAKNSGATKAAAEPKMPVGAKNSGATKAAAEPKMPAGAKNYGAAKAAAEPKMPVGAKNSGAAKAAAEPKMPAGAKKPEVAKKALESKKTTEPKKVAESKAKEMHKPAQLPGTTEVVKSTEAGESTDQDAEETCVVVISNLPEAGLTLDDVSNLTKPFGGLKDLLIVTSHKKAYLEISCTPAESLVKFYSCFPKWVEKNQLCFAVASEFKDVKNEEAIFVAMIKDANPKVNTETLHAQFVYLGNLPDGGYSELEILCVGLRFGRVDHYMVITNKNKAILQLDSIESAASMCRFLKRYPYCLGEYQLTFSRSPKIEPLTAEVTKREVKKVEPSKESPDLKKIPEGSGVVHPAAVPSAKPIEAQEEPSSSLKAKIPEGKTEQSGTDKMVCEAPAKPSKTEASEGGCGVAATLPADIPMDVGSSEKQLEEALALPPKLEKDGKILDIGNKAELLENVSTSAAGNGGNTLSVCAGELSEELQSKTKTESVGSDFARTEEKEELPAAHCEIVSPDSAEAPVEVSGDDLQSSSKLTSKADGSDASGNLAEMPATKIDKEAGVLIDKETGAPFSTDEAGLKVQPWAPLGETVEAKKKKSKLQTVEGEAAAEKQYEVLVSDRGPTTEKKPENSANEESSEQILEKAQPNEDTEEAQSEESSKASTLATESTPSVVASSVSKTILKTLKSVPTILKTRTATRKKEAQTPATKMGTRSQSAAEKKPVPKEISPQSPTSSRPNMPDGSKPKLNVSSLVVKVGSGKSSSRQDKNSRVETKGSSNQTCERDSRSSSMKRDNGINKVSTGKNTRSPKSSTKSKEEEELFPFNLDEFVTVDEVTDEVDSPSQSRKNLPRAKRKEPAKKNTSSEPTLKRKKGKNSSVCAAVAELSFVTLDEIGEDEGGMAQAAEFVHLGAMPDPQVLVTVDEVNDEEEQISEVVRDPQLLVTLDEISEQEESAAKDTFPLGEPDLKAGPLVTVDEIGEVEELPLSEPLHFKVDEALKPSEEEKQASKDLGDFLSSRMPDDPSSLVTVDEIHEDGEDQPLVTVDEVAEDDEDFLADFNRMKEELNFVTVDEVGSEDDAEEQDNIFTGTRVDTSVAETVSAGETRMQISEPGEDVIPSKPDESVVSAEPEVMGNPHDTPLEMRVSAGDELSEENKMSEVHVEATEKQSSAAEMNMVETTLVKAGKDEKKADLEKNKLSDTGCEQQCTEPVLNRTEWPGSKEQNMGKDQQPSESGSHEEDIAMKATEMEVEGSSLPTSDEKETAGEVQMSSLDLDVSVADTQTAKAGELNREPELSGQDLSIHPDASLKEESCSDVTPSQSSEKSEKGVTDSECKEPESKRRKVESAENSNVSSQPKGLEFLVPKAGFFCQICSLFCVDEASMKTHCQTQLHEQNMQKFMIKNNTQEEEKKDGEENAEEQSSR